MKKIMISILVIIAFGAAWWLLHANNVAAPSNTTAVGAADPKSATYMIEGQPVTLGGSTTYFGNDLQIDLDGDGRIDTAFIVTQRTGGSGTFYYAVAARNTEHGYVGSDSYLLGDRIAPQSTTPSPNAAQKGVVVFNYADRAPSEPMTTKPSIGKSVYLKLDVPTMRWGIVDSH